MVSCITSGVKVSVQVTYQAQHSKPRNGYFVFSYAITIENKSEDSIRLLRRHWHIFDASNGWHEVEGEGVISQQPVLYPGEEYQYESYCPLNCELGKMYGTYLMENKKTGATFYVNIPEFRLVAIQKYN
jgi:ApaG protein